MFMRGIRSLDQVVSRIAHDPHDLRNPNRCRGRLDVFGNAASDSTAPVEIAWTLPLVAERNGETYREPWVPLADR